jgi:class 3 adenylate cyclase
MTEAPVGSEPFEMQKLFGETLVESIRTIVKEQLERYEESWKPSNYCVRFSDKSVSYCIGLVDMVDSTKMAASLGMSRMSRYYQSFLNLMSKIIAEFEGQIIKNVGDCLLFYFPKTSNWQSKDAMTKSLECSIAMIGAHEFLCSQMRMDGLPCIDYRISMDYGYVIPMKSSDSKSVDMIGPAINMCSKINRCAERNGIVIGGDLYQVAKHLDVFSFKEIKGYSVGFKHNYPVYRVARR